MEGRGSCFLGLVLQFRNAFYYANPRRTQWEVLGIFKGMQE